MTPLIVLYLSGAIATELVGTLSLKVAATGRRRWYVPVVIGYTVAFTLLALALRAGMPLGTGYGIWVAVGVALTAVLSRALFKEPLTLPMLFGIVLISAGVMLILGGANG